MPLALKPLTLICITGTARRVQGDSNKSLTQLLQLPVTRLGRARRTSLRACVSSPMSAPAASARAVCCARGLGFRV